MAVFQNTIDLLGDDAVFASVVERTISEFKDDVLTTIGYNAFRNCSALTNVDLPNATSIAAYAFYSCSAFTRADLPNATSIGNDAFEFCSKLTIVDLPNATSIGYNAFRYCSTLTNVDLPNATSLGIGAFDNCSKLASIRLPAVPPTLTNTNAFNRVPGTCVFYIPTGSLAAYQAATNWSALTSQYSFVEEDR